MAEEDQARWDETYRLRGAPLAEPSRFLLEQATLLPSSGRALDVAGGTGRHALWLARRGLATTLVDISTVALELALEQAAGLGVHLGVLRRDLEIEGLPEGRYDVIAWFDYLDRRALEQVASRLAPGGVFVFAHPTQRNLERHPKPSARFLLAEGEAKTLGAGLELVTCDEGWFEDGPPGAIPRHLARLVARAR